MNDKNYLIDDKNYTVVGINGVRKPCLTRQQAFKEALRILHRMGWRGNVRVYYRDGTDVALETEPKDD